MKKEKFAPRARMCLDYTEDRHWATVDKVRTAGFRVVTAPVGALCEPELTFKLRKYRGYKEIDEFLKFQK